MRNLLILSLALALSPFASADLIIYKNKITFTKTGGGTVTKGSSTGWTIHDPVTGDMWHLFSDPKGKTFVSQDGDYSIDHVSGEGKGFVILAQGKTFYDAGDFLHVNNVIAKGEKVSLDVGASTSYNAPKNYNVTIHLVHPDAAGELQIEEGSGKLTFDRTQTFASNKAGETLAQAVERLRLILISNGYFELKAGKMENAPSSSAFSEIRFQK